MAFLIYLLEMCGCIFGAILALCLFMCAGFGILKVAGIILGKLGVFKALEREW